MWQAGVVHANDNHPFSERKLPSLALGGFQQWKTFPLGKFSLTYAGTPL